MLRRSEAEAALAPVLTPGQLRVAVEVACTESDYLAIAARLFLSVNTVKTHMRNAYITCGLRPQPSRAKLRAWVAERSGTRPPCA